MGRPTSTVNAPVPRTTMVARFLIALAALAFAVPAVAQDDPLEQAILQGYAAMQTGDLATATAIFETVVGQAPSYGPGHAGLAAVAAAEADWDAVVPLARTAISYDPTIPLAHGLLCRALVVRGEHGEALVSCDRSIELAPDDPQPRASACAASLALRRYPTAARQCAGAVDADLSDASSWWRLGVALTHIGQLGDAESQCRAAIDTAQGEPMAHYCLGSVQLHRRDFEGALTTCQRAVEVGPSNALAHYCRGMAQLGRGDIDAARTDCDRAVSLAPGEALGHYCLGRIARDEGRWDAAVQHLDAALQRNDTLVEARGSIGDVLTRAGDPVAGEDWIRQALDSDPSAERYAQLGQNLFAQRRYDDALEAYADADQRRPGHVATLANMGLCHHGAGRTTEGLALLERAIEAEPTNPAWARTLVDTALSDGRYIPAIEAARDAVERHPDHPELNTLLCSALVRSSNYDEAEPACVRAGTVAPSDPTPQGLLGVVYIETNRPTEAETVLRAAVGLGAEDPYTWINLGNTLINLGRASDAVEVFDEATRRGPTLAMGFYGLGVARYDSGDAEGARAAFCRARELQPGRVQWQEACETGTP